ncbi:MAG: hypothetical protein JWM36_3177 [Hyphomicrobiales bacterium]|nr:hypothetical protein [Hyphomicrobiales bacterium]
MSSEAAVIDRYHNEPPLKDRLAMDHADLVEQLEQIAARATDAPKTIEDDDGLSVLAAIVKDTQSVTKKLETKRVAEKEPHLAAGREVDGFFAGHKTRAERIISEMNRRNTLYLRAKADRERQERLEQERVAREAHEAAMREAERLDAANRRAEADQVLEEAQQADIDARVAATAAAAKPAELARTRTASGTTTLVTRWEFQLTDFAALSPSAVWPYFTRAEIEKAIGVAVRNGVRSLDGVHIFENSVAQSR